MISFYQSPLRKEINQHIYHKPLFETEILGTTYWGIVKKKRRLGREFCWYMIHGVLFPTYEDASQELREACTQLQHDHGSRRSDILLQLGSINTFDRSPTKEIKQTEAAQLRKAHRVTIQKNLKDRYGLVPTRREHMPCTTVVLDTTTPFRSASLSSSGRRGYNKGERSGLDFVSLDTKEYWSQYREVRQRMADDKGFHVLPREMFLELMDFLYTHEYGVLFGALRDGKLVTGAVYLFHDDQLIYLYGMTDRSFGDIGAPYRLTGKIIDRAHTHDRNSIDMLGVAPVGMESEHHLKGVTKFKQSFGGMTHSYVGSYDLVTNRLLYRLLKKTK